RRRKNRFLNHERYIPFLQSRTVYMNFFVVYRTPLQSLSHRKVGIAPSENELKTTAHLWPIKHSIAFGFLDPSCRNSSGMKTDFFAVLSHRPYTNRDSRVGS